MKSLLRIALRNVTSNWRHSLASLMSIIATYFCLNIFQGYIDDLANLYLVSYRERSMFGDLMIMSAKGDSPAARVEPWKYGIRAEEQAAVQKFIQNHKGEISTSVRFLDAQGTITNGRVSTLFFTHGYDLQEGAKMRGKQWAWNTLYGEPLDHAGDSGNILVGQILGRILNCNPDQKQRAIVADGGYDPVVRPFHCQTPTVQLAVATDSGQFNALDLNVMGIIDAGYSDIDKRFLWMSLKDAQTLLHTDRLSYITILASDGVDLRQLSRAFDDEVRSRFSDLSMKTWQDHPRSGELYNRTMDLLSIFRNFVVIVIIAISGLSVFNSMTKSLSERTREIGTLLSIGYRKKHIRIIFCAETFLLVMIGLAIGMAFSAGTALAVNHIGIFYRAGMLSEPVAFRISLSFGVALVGSAGILLLSMLATFLACERVLQKKIIDCLAYA